LESAETLGERVAEELARPAPAAAQLLSDAILQRHGEAVAAGMCMAAEFSAALGRATRQDVERTRALLQRMNLPVAPPAIAVDAFMAAMAIDKKVVAGEIRLVLLQGIGAADVTADYPLDEMVALLGRQLGH